MSRELDELVIRHLKAENAHDLDSTLATLHPDCRFEDMATGQNWSGHAGASAHYRQWWDTFDVEVTRMPGQLTAWSADGLGRLSEATWRGRHIGKFLGIEPTGRTIVQPFVVVLTFKDGLMLGERFHYDLAALVRQIGADPLPAVGGMAYRRAA